MLILGSNVLQNKIWVIRGLWRLQLQLTRLPQSLASLLSCMVVFSLAFAVCHTKYMFKLVEIAMHYWKVYPSQGNQHSLHQESYYHFWLYGCSLNLFQTTLFFGHNIFWVIFRVILSYFHLRSSYFSKYMYVFKRLASLSLSLLPIVQLIHLLILWMFF